METKSYYCSWNNSENYDEEVAKSKNLTAAEEVKKNEEQEGAEGEKEADNENQSRLLILNLYLNN